jgi:hypothetical protein
MLSIGDASRTPETLQTLLCCLHLAGQLTEDVYTGKASIEDTDIRPWVALVDKVSGLSTAAIVHMQVHLKE